jgi:hypothetical protein
MGAPGCPLFAACTASIDNTRMALASSVLEDDIYQLWFFAERYCQVLLASLQTLNI